MLNRYDDRNSLLKAVCEQRGYALKLTNDVRIVEVSDGRRELTIARFDYGLLSSSAAEIIDSKSMTYSFLDRIGLQCVPHHLAYFRGAFIDNPILAEKLVLKPDVGTGGRNIVFVGRSDYASSVRALSSLETEVAVCEYIPYEFEYRCVSVDGSADLVLEKRRGKSRLHNERVDGDVYLAGEKHHKVAKKMARKIYRATGWKFLVIDFFYSEGIPTIMELNRGFDSCAVSSNDIIEKQIEIVGKLIGHKFQELNGN